MMRRCNNCKYTCLRPIDIPCNACENKSEWTDINMSKKVIKVDWGNIDDIPKEFRTTDNKFSRVCSDDWKKTNIVKLNPIEAINEMLKRNQPQVKDHEGTIKLSNIEFDKDVIPEYYLIRKSTHDGTMMFTQELLDKTLLCLINRTTCYIPTQPKDASTVKDIKYTIGGITLTYEFGMKDLKCGKCEGVTNTVSIPVRCEYILK